MPNVEPGLLSKTDKNIRSGIPRVLGDPMWRCVDLPTFVLSAEKGELTIKREPQ